MEYMLENEKIRLEFSDLGGELKSLWDKETAQEYLWQGQKPYWEESAPNLFPYIGRMTAGKYRYQGKEYQMPIHGFVKSTVMYSRQTEEKLVFQLESNESTRAYYPFSFIYRIQYSLQDTTLNICYEVENTDERSMYFGIGGHPGFQVPFHQHTTFEDYCIEFEAGVSPIEILFSEDCFVAGEQRYLGLSDFRLPLTHALFDHDAIVLKNAGKKAILYRSNGDSKQEHKAIIVRFPQMDYVGLWHNPETEAPFVCIEPWSSLPSRQGIVEDLEQQDNLICLPAGLKYRNDWSISLAWMQVH